MKKQLLTGAIALSALTAGAQVNDTVYVGAGYANQVWYSLESDDQGSAPKANWDLAFDVSGFGSTIYVNHSAGDTLWAYPSADATGWSTVDISGLSSWTPRWNADTSWTMGAMGRYADPSDATDLDWGKYNMTTHIISGDSIYVIKVAGVGYKKLMIESLSGGSYSFKYANIDGTDAQTATLAKSAYTGKNFGYYSLSANAALDREPASASWDLLFGSYTRNLPSEYGVTGVLANNDVRVAKCVEVADVATFTAYSTATFNTAINVIGYDWKTFNGTAYDIEDSTVFFVEPANGDIWKVVFTGFGGSSTGAMMFSKEKLYTAPPAGTTGVMAATPSVALYPNPASGSNVNLVYSFPAAVPAASVTITDMTGKVILREGIQGGEGLQQHIINTSSLMPGMYLVQVTGGNYTSMPQLIKQ